MCCCGHACEDRQVCLWSMLWTPSCSIRPTIHLGLPVSCQPPRRYSADSRSTHPTLDVSDQGSIQFIWHSFHSLLQVSVYILYVFVSVFNLSFTCLQVTKDSHELCGHGSPLLREWGLPGVDTAVTVSHIALRVCYYICRVADHCDAGMKIIVVVQQRSTLLSLIIHIHATCIGCILSYNSDAKPLLPSVNVSFIKQIEICSLQLYTFVLCFCTNLCI